MDIITMHEAKLILTGKGYAESTFQEFNKTQKYAGNIKQFYISEHNLNNVLKSCQGYRNNLYYFIEGSPGLQIRTWQY